MNYYMILKGCKTYINSIPGAKFGIMALLVLFTIPASAQRQVIDLSKKQWKLWLDTTAQWQHDELYGPSQVKLDNLPVKVPTGGWSALDRTLGKSVTLPATVEEYYWGRNGNQFGVTGNYLGVSWFSLKFTPPAGLKGRRLVLNFESVRFRAEVFVNRKLVGYDLVNSTPFDVDVTDVLIAGKENTIDVRITDPNGNFDWRDSQNFMWGNYRTQPSHGFGGITGSVKLTATDEVYISDVFVKNTPALNAVNIEVTSSQGNAASRQGTYQLQIIDNQSAKVVYEKQYPVLMAQGKTVSTLPVQLPNAKLWDTERPNLYTAVVKLNSGSNTDSYQQRFGFRWFEVKNVNGDQQFYLNNKRIVLRTSISWGFWPVNGIAPSNELARKQVTDAKLLGLNMLNFHRTIGQQNVLDAADELGLLYFEEPGGNQFPEALYNPRNEVEKKQKEFYMDVRSEKFFRMIRRDRSHPSLVIYNMHNERGAQPQQLDRQEMLAGHQLDDTRIITYNSSNGTIKLNDPDPKFKLHLLPYDSTFYDYGWFDQHHAGGPGVYHDNLYNGPKSYAKYTDHKNEIIYYGEEGAIGTPPRLQLIRNEILKAGRSRGWESDAYLKWYDAYDQFITRNGFLKAFPNVDSLTRKMGNVAYYYQGRVIENVRINNIIDGYAINGWESMKLENHSGVVDNYRNLKGDPELIARYNRPLYLAVKLNHKVLRLGDTTVADVYMVNEKGISGRAQLELKLADNKGKTTSVKIQDVSITGGTQYGELLLQGVRIPIRQSGYSNISATLTQANAIICKGSDHVFAVDLRKQNVSKQLLVADTSNIIQGFLSANGVIYHNYHSGIPAGHVMVTGAFDPQQTGNPLVTNLLEWVNNGNTLVVIGNQEKWAAYLAKKEVVDYRGMQVLGTSWYGGNFFVKRHPFFTGLPQDCVFNWEYQSLATYNKSRIGLRILNGETVVGCVSDHKPEVYSALSVIPHGRGKVVICTLDLISCIKDVKAVKKAEGDGENAAMSSFNFSAANPANVVAQQLLFNLLKD